VVRFVSASSGQEEKGEQKIAFLFLRRTLIRFVFFWCFWPDETVFSYRPSLEDERIAQEAAAMAALSAALLENELEENVLLLAFVTALFQNSHFKIASFRYKLV